MHNYKLLESTRTVNRGPGLQLNRGPSMSDQTQKAPRSTIKRREFLASAALPVAAALAPRAVLGQQAGSANAAPDRIRVGIIGAGGIVGSDAHPGTAPDAGRRDRRGRESVARIEPPRRGRVRHPARVRGLGAIDRCGRHRRRADRHVAVHAPHDHAGRARERPACAVPGAHGQQRGRGARDAGRIAATSESRMPCSCRARAATASTERC